MDGYYVQKMQGRGQCHAGLSADGAASEALKAAAQANPIREQWGEKRRESARGWLAKRGSDGEKMRERKRSVGGCSLA